MRFMAAMVAVLMFALGSSLAQAQGSVEVQWLGQAAMKITTPGGKVILIDPFLTKNPKTPAQYKNLDAVGKIDLILVTHAHGDHLGDAPELSAKNNAKIIAPNGLSLSLIELGVVKPAQVLRMNKSGTVSPIGPGVKVTMVAAEHSSELSHRNPSTGKDEIHVGGEAAGFIVELENGFKIWHMGDTGLFGDMKTIAEIYKPDLVMMPIGGHFTMGPVEAALATREWIKPRFVIPMHYGTFAFLKGTPQEYKQALGQSNTRVLVLNPGDVAGF
jgi:L-ascorbate metabolism protein UlaG (beta-lactamase superfamily)